jgi:cell division protein ZapE
VRRLVDLTVDVSPDQLVQSLVPPPRFAGVGFDTYQPDPAQPSQVAALAATRRFAASVAVGPEPQRVTLFRRRGPRPPEVRAGLYLDGGFGVGKTHLLASLWHEAPAPKAFATFVELTNLAGALGFDATVQSLAGLRVLAIDEFELDDPGDTVLMSSLLSRLVARGVRLAATSNTLPDRLGEDRFAAEDFLREIQALSAQFDVVRIDGEDYRHRGMLHPPAPLTEAELVAAAERTPGATLDAFDELLEHLATVHPSRYGAWVSAVSAVHLCGLRPVDDQAAALRLVVLVDRLYDRAVPVRVSGTPVAELFPRELLRGGYRKKYYRALSRLSALAEEGQVGT